MKTMFNFLFVLAIALGAFWVLTPSVLAAAPANDTIGGATPVSLGYSELLDTTEATTDSDDVQLNLSCGAPATDASVWYAFTTSNDAQVVVDVSQSNYSAGILVGVGVPGNLQTIACGPFTVTFSASAGTTYYVLAFDFDGSGNGGMLSISFNYIQPPANDDFDNATTITALPFTDSINTSGATSAADDPTDCYGTYASVWYELTSITNFQMQVDIPYSDYDTVVAVYTGTRGNLNLIACWDNPCFTLDVYAGETYYFMVTSYYGSGGNLVFSVDVAPPPLTIDLKVDPINFVNNGITTVSGTVNSSVPVDAYVSVQVRQKAGRVFITGYNNTYVYTADGVAHWTMQVPGDIGPFLPGKATVRAIAQGCSYGGCGGGSCAETPEVAETVRLMPSHPTTTVLQSTTTVPSTTTTGGSTTTTVPVTSTSVPSTTTISIPPDRDGDGVPDAIDNCPDNCNTMQLDADMDGIGDVCDKNPGCGKGKKPACEQQC